jgi:histidinol-phosphate aminotransferase
MSARLLELVPDGLRALSAYSVPAPTGIEVKLDANEHPYALPREAREALARELAEVDVNRYPASDGGELRAVIADELGVAANALVFGNGSDELITFLVAALSKPRAGAQAPAILYPVPTFVVFRLACLAHGARAVEVPLSPEFELEVDRVSEAIARERPNVAFFARPNNPTGTLWPRSDLAALARAHPDVLFVSDEAYDDYCGDSMVGDLGEHPNLAVMRTLSKIGLAGLRIGFLCAAPALSRELEKVRAPYNVGSLNLHAAVWILRNLREELRAQCEHVARERDALYAELERLPGVRPFPSRANLILFRVGEAAQGRAREVWERLCARGVLVRNLDGPGPLAGCLRVTIGTPEENARFLEALKASL